MRTKISLFVGFVLLFGSNLFAQFVTTGTATTSNLWSGGAVGVGYTTTPTFGTNKFMVSGNSVFTGNAQVTGTSQVTGSTGLGMVPNASYKLGVVGNSYFNGVIGLGVVPTTSYRLGVAGNSYFNGFVGIGVVPNTSFRIASVGNSYFNGNVHIGAATAGSTRLQITGAAVNDSGLRLTNLTNTSTVSTTNNGRVLAVDNLGKVILVNDATAAATTGWNLTGNSGTSASTNFIGTTDDVDLVFKRNNMNAGLISTTNSIIGANAGQLLLEDFVNFSGLANTMMGNNAGASLVNGNGNVFLGNDAGDSETDCRVNTFVGSSAGRNHTGNGIPGDPDSGNGNTFIGEDSGGFTGNENVDLGTKAGYNSNGSKNVYLGAYTGAGITGNANTFLGSNIAPLTTTLSNTVILADGDGNQRLIVDNTGAATITGLAGTNTGMVVSADDNGKLMMVASSGGANIYSTNGSLAGDRTVDMNNSNLAFNTTTSTTKGKIYIGSNPSFAPDLSEYKLFVEGGVLTEKVRVSIKGSGYWPDYVFDNKYKLMPLNELESFYNKNKHLPNIPSAKEIAKGGLELGEMQTKQMEKIEELTLYVVEQNKAIQKQDELIKEQYKDIQELKSLLNELLNNKK